MVSSTCLFCRMYYHKRQLFSLSLPMRTKEVVCGTSLCHMFIACACFKIVLGAIDLPMCLLVVSDIFERRAVVCDESDWISLEKAVKSWSLALL